MSSMVESSLREDNYCSDQTLFLRMGLPKLSNALKEEHFRNKLIMMRMKEECYFILSCKTPLCSHEDDHFLPEDIIHPLQPNTLYYFEQDKLANSKVV